MIIGEILVDLGEKCLLTSGVKQGCPLIPRLLNFFSQVIGIQKDDKKKQNIYK